MFGDLTVFVLFFCIAFLGSDCNLYHFCRITHMWDTHTHFLHTHKDKGTHLHAHTWMDFMDSLYAHALLDAHTLIHTRRHTHSYTCPHTHMLQRQHHFPTNCKELCKQGHLYYTFIHRETRASHPSPAHLTWMYILDTKNKQLTLGISAPNKSWSRKKWIKDQVPSSSYCTVFTLPGTVQAEHTPQFHCKQTVHKKAFIHTLRWMGKDKSLLAKGSAKARLRMQVAGEHGRETTPASLPQQHYSACSLCVNSQLQPPPHPSILPKGRSRSVACCIRGWDRGDRAHWPMVEETGGGWLGWRRRGWGCTVCTKFEDDVREPDALNGWGIYFTYMWTHERMLVLTWWRWRYEERENPHRKMGEKDDLAWYATCCSIIIIL